MQNESEPLRTCPAGPRLPTLLRDWARSHALRRKSEIDADAERLQDERDKLDKMLNDTEENE